MDKYLTRILIACILAWSMIPFPSSFAQGDSYAKIQQQLDQIRAKKRSQQEEVMGIDSQIRSIKNQSKSLDEELMTIDLRRNETQQKIDRMENEIASLNQKIVKTQAELDQAEERVAKREGLLNSRVKGMYERGTISYLDILFGARSFGEFLTLLVSIQTILNQDMAILEDNRQDQQQIEAKSNEMKQSLALFEQKAAESERLKLQLEQQYKDSLVVMASLEQEEKRLTEYKEEEEQQLMELIAQESAKQAERMKNQPVKVSQYRGGKLFLPLPQGSYRLTSPFGYRKDPFTGRASGHNGLDLAAPKGTDIYAAEDGIVMVAGYQSGYGNAVVIKHNNEISTLYAHIREGGILVKSGQVVKRGQKIAEVGSTGRSTGNHLHFTVYQNNNAKDPFNFLN